MSTPGSCPSIRDGQQPWSASFAFNNAVELPQPLDQRTNDLSARRVVGESQGHVPRRLGWIVVHQHNQSLVWDNPIRLTDFNNGPVLPAERALRPERLQQRQRPGAGTRIDSRRTT